MPDNKALHKSIIHKFIDLQHDLTLIQKDKVNPFHKSKYASLDDIQLALQPLLKKHGLGYTQTVTQDGLVTTLHDTEGQTIEGGVYPLDLTLEPQKLGSAITYAKRYALSSFLGLIIGGDDDDGNETTIAQTDQKKWFNKPELATFKEDLENLNTMQDLVNKIKAIKSTYRISKDMSEELNSLYQNKLNKLK